MLFSINIIILAKVFVSIRIFKVLIINIILLSIPKNILLLKLLLNLKEKKVIIILKSNNNNTILILKSKKVFLQNNFILVNILISSKNLWFWSFYKHY